MYKRQAQQCGEAQQTQVDQHVQREAGMRDAVHRRHVDAVTEGRAFRPVSYTHLLQRRSATCANNCAVSTRIWQTSFCAAKQLRTCLESAWLITPCVETIAAGNTPVSYTHLDVYKRQFCCCISPQLTMWPTYWVPTSTAWVLKVANTA